MITLRNLFTNFGHDPQWQKLATKSAQSMVSVFMRKLGNTDISTLTDFDIELQLAMSEQPEDRKVKARSCMHYLLLWAKEQGNQVPQIAHPFQIKQETKNEKDNDETDTQLRLHRRCDTSEIKADRQSKEKQESDTSCRRRRSVRHARSSESGEHHKISGHSGNRSPRACKSDSESKTRRERTKTKAQSKTCCPGTEERKEKVERKRGRLSTGTIYSDNGSKGWKNNKRVFNDCWRAEITIDGQRFRHRSKERKDCAEWLKAVKQGKIKPTDNKADWWRMEQHKDEETRIDELIVSAAEEANIVYEYRQTRDTEILYNYCIKALLPHMVYYCCHTLRLGLDRSLTCSRQAVGLILTKIVGGRPITNITFTCKRMLRTYKNRGDFWYYDNAPEAVKLMVNRIDMSALEELYKVTKDRRI
jgi:hypothetical protein